MSFGIFKQGGPHKIRRTGPHQHEFSISLPADRDGRVARKCPDHSCSPGDFKVKPRPNIVNSKEVAFCPYCGKESSPNEFITQEQLRYANEILKAEALQGIQKEIARAFGLNSQGKRSLTKGGLVDISLEMKPIQKPYVHRPYSDVLRRDVICPKCGLDHSVYGLATYCSHCGSDIFTTHILGELQVIEHALADIPRRESLLGERIAAKDLENALEDLVSVFEAVLKREVRQRLSCNSLSTDEVEKKMKKIGSRLQSVRNAQEILPALGISLEFFDSQRLSKLDILFQKRHPITHNLGVIDRSYLEKIKSAERKGREVRISAREIRAACEEVFQFLEELHLQLYPEAQRAIVSRNDEFKPDLETNL